MWDFSAGTAIWLMARTLPYLLLRLALYFAITFAYIVATGTGAAIGYTLGLAGSDDFQAQATIFGAISLRPPESIIQTTPFLSSATTRAPRAASAMAFSRVLISLF